MFIVVVSNGIDIYFDVSVLVFHMHFALSESLYLKFD